MGGCWDWRCWECCTAAPGVGQEGPAGLGWGDLATSGQWEGAGAGSITLEGAGICAGAHQPNFHGFKSSLWAEGVRKTPHELGRSRCSPGSARQGPLQPFSMEMPPWLWAVSLGTAAPASLPGWWHPGPSVGVSSVFLGQSLFPTEAEGAGGRKRRLMGAVPGCGREDKDPDTSCSQSPQ